MVSTDKLTASSKITTDAPSSQKFVTSFNSHRPRTITEILAHFPLLTSGQLPRELLEKLFEQKGSFGVLLRANGAFSTRSHTPSFSSRATSQAEELSLDMQIALIAALNASRVEDRTTVLLVNTTREAKRAIAFLLQAFGPLCRISSTNSSLSTFVPCDLFSDVRIVIGTYRSFLRKLLTDDLPSFQTVVLVHPPYWSSSRMFATLLLDILLLRLRFTAKQRSSVRTIFVCRSVATKPANEVRNNAEELSLWEFFITWLNVPFFLLKHSSESLATTCHSSLSSFFSAPFPRTPADSFAPLFFPAIFSSERSFSQLVLLPMLAVLFRRHLSRKQLFFELKQSIVYRLFRARKATRRLLINAPDRLSLEKTFEKLLYKAFHLLSRPSLGGFRLIIPSHNRYTLSKFAEEFLIALTYSRANLASIIAFLLFLCSSAREGTLNWEALIRYLGSSFPLESNFHASASFDQLAAFIQTIRLQLAALTPEERASPSRALASSKKLAVLFRSKNFSFQDFQFVQLVAAIGSQFSDEPLLSQTLGLIKTQMLKSFFSSNTPRKKYSLYNRQRAKELLLSELLHSPTARTATDLALTLQLDKKLVDRLLRSLAQKGDALISSQTVVTASGRRSYFGLSSSFPSYFKHSCSECQFYSPVGNCTVYQTLGRFAPHKVPTLYRQRAERQLKPSTVACSLFLLKELRKDTLSLEVFASKTRAVHSLTPEGVLFEHHCLYCSALLPSFGSDFLPKVGTSAQSCPSCGSIYKLTRQKQKQKGNTKGASESSPEELIFVSCLENRLNAFNDLLYDLSGLSWEHLWRQQTSSSSHGMTIRIGEHVSLQGEFLIVENIAKKISDLDYLYSSIPLPSSLVSKLETAGVTVRFNFSLVEEASESSAVGNNNLVSPESNGCCSHDGVGRNPFKNSSSAQQLTPDQCLALKALRITGLLTAPFLRANVLSRWAVTIQLFPLLSRYSSDALEERSLPLHSFEWEFLDVLLRSRVVSHAFTFRLCEGLAGAIMWSFLKEVFDRHGLRMFSRVRDRYVRDKLFFPHKRTLAYSAMSALVNFFLLLVQDRLQLLHLDLALGWKGSPGLIHGTKKTSALDSLGFFLDFIDIIKIAAFLFVAQLVHEEALGFDDVEVTIGRAGISLYAVKPSAIRKLEQLVDLFFDQEVYYLSKKLSLTEAYRLYTTHFYDLLAAIAEQLKNTYSSFPSSTGGEGTLPLSSWLERWETLPEEQRKKLFESLYLLVSSIPCVNSYSPLSYLPSSLVERREKLLSFLPSIEDFPVNLSWEEQLLHKNGVANFVSLTRKLSWRLFEDERQGD